MSTLIGLFTTLCVFGVIAVFVLAVLGYSAWTVRSAMAAAQEHQQPINIPTPNDYGMALVSIITGGDDYGSWPPKAPSEMLGSSWGITDEAGARSQISEFLLTQSGKDALVFDRVRAAHLARAAAGATYLDQASSWEFVRKASRDIQAVFGSWDEVGAAYIKGKNEWLTSRGLSTDDGTEAKVALLSQTTWRSIPFELSL